MLIVCACVCLRIWYFKKIDTGVCLLFVAFQCLSFFTIIISHDTLMCLLYPALLP